MMIDRVTACLTPELGQALRALALQRGESISATVEVLMREHPAIRRQVETCRGWKKGRSPDKLRAMAEAARANWQRAEQTGQVRIRAP